MHLHVKTEDVIGRHLYKYGAHDPPLTEFLKRHLTFEDGDVVLDIGANVGWYSLLLDRIAGGKDVDVFAFEPEPTNFSLLEENVVHNAANHVTGVRCAIADAAGTRTMHLYDKSNRGRHSLLAINDGEKIDVETVSVDAFWEAKHLGARVPRFIKMDIEGFELVALRGATKVLSRCPLVMLEYSPSYMRAGALEPADLVELMLEQGFRAYTLGDGCLEPMGTLALLSSDRHMDLFWSRL